MNMNTDGLNINVGWLKHRWAEYKIDYLDKLTFIMIKIVNNCLMDKALTCLWESLY